MDGFVAVTDPGWYEYLSREPGPKDANFWRPSARAFQLKIGTPFFFKLKAPHHAIGGFGYFAGFSILPDWLAWDTFGTANGVNGLAQLRAQLSRIQEGARIQGDPRGSIGCCLIAEARFFQRDAWVGTHTVDGSFYSAGNVCNSFGGTQFAFAFPAGLVLGVPVRDNLMSP
jgi:putative restriction endonuclease